MTIAFSRSRLRVAAVVFMLTEAQPLSADPLVHVNLKWRAPVDCPGAASLQAQLSRDLQGSQTTEALEIDADVARSGDGYWVAHVHTRSAAGQSDRSLVARSCQALADATSLIVAMQIDPETAATHARVIDGLSEPAGGGLVEPVNEPSRTPASGDPVQRPASPTAVAAAQPGLPAQASSQRPSAAGETTNKQQKPPLLLPSITAQSHTLWRGFIGAWVTRDWGSLPASSEIFGGSIGLNRGLWWGEFAAGTSLREDLLVRSGQAVGSLGLATGTLRLCRRSWGPRRVALAICGGPQWARWSSQGNQNLANNRSETALTLSAEARLIGMLMLFEQVQLLLPVDVVLPLNRPRFGVTQAAEQREELFEPAWIALRIGAGLQLAMP